MIATALWHRVHNHCTKEEHMCNKTQVQDKILDKCNILALYSV